MQDQKLSLSEVLDPEDVDDGDAALVGRTRSIPDWDCNPHNPARKTAVYISFRVFCPGLLIYTEDYKASQCYVTRPPYLGSCGLSKLECTLKEYRKSVP